VLSHRPGALLAGGRSPSKSLNYSRLLISTAYFQDSTTRVLFNHGIGSNISDSTDISDLTIEEMPFHVAIRHDRVVRRPIVLYYLDGK
jgi:hypothetical protein